MRTYADSRYIKMAVVRLLQRYNRDMVDEKYDRPFVKTLVNELFSREELNDNAEANPVVVKMIQEIFAHRIKNDAVRINKFSSIFKTVWNNLKQNH